MFEVNELLEATQGKLISNPGDRLIRGISIDSRTIKKNEAFIAIKGNSFDGHDFISEAIEKGASCIIKESQIKEGAIRGPIPDTRGIAVIEVKDTIKALGDIAQFWCKKFNIPVVAVTGSNGKTTAKDMIAYILSKRFKVLKNEGTKNNQIGLPLTLLNLKPLHEMAVLEIGTNHFGEIDYLSKICQPNIGIIINIGSAHLEYLKNLEGVLREKYALVENLKKPYIAILNADDNLLREKILKKIRKPFILGFGIINKSDLSASDIRSLNGKIEFSVNPALPPLLCNILRRGGVNQKYKFTPLEIQQGKTNLRSPKGDLSLTRFTLKTLGYYNVYNALAAIAVARLFGMEYKEMALRLADFVFPSGRLKFMTLNNIRFIDDTYNSNPVSLRQALITLNDYKTKGRKIFIMGDMLELGRLKESFHHQAGKEAVRICDVFITVGKLSKLAADAAKGVSLNAQKIFTCETCKEARNILFDKISPKKDDVVLVKGSRAMRMEEVFRI